jgi:hypothetical protein
MVAAAQCRTDPTKPTGRQTEPIATRWPANSKIPAVSRAHRALASLIACALAGCAPMTRGPIRIGCTEAHMQPLPPGMQRLTFEGFSVLPPQGDNWCIEHLDKKTGVAFGTSPLIGQVLTQRPPEAELYHTFAAMAFVAQVEGEAVNTPAQLRDFVNRWLHAGQPGRFSAGKMILVASPVAAPRFTLVNSSVVIDEPTGGNCIRFDATAEERNNPTWPTEVLAVVAKGNLLCRFPGPQEATFVLIGASERYNQAHQPHPLLTETRAQEVEAFTRSLSSTQPSP